MPREKSAGAVVFRREDSKIYYLLLHYESGHWDFPKGHIEKGENEAETVKREVAEETGLKDIEIIDGFKEYIKYFFRQTYGLPQEEKKKVPWTFKIVVFYLAEVKTKEASPVRSGVSNGVKISFEHQGYKWLAYEEALKQLTFKNAKEILKKANDFLISKIKTKGEK